MIKSVWGYRNFIIASIKGELSGRFKRSSIGALWFILHPLAMSTIYIIILSNVLGAKIGSSGNEGSYAIYLVSSIAIWGLFNEICNRCVNLFIEYGHILKKISFPRLCLPIIVLGNALVTHVFLLLAIFIVFLFFGHFPTLKWISLPVAIIIASSFGLGLGILLGTLNVFSRDVKEVMNVIFQLWFWVTPIVYPIDILDAKIQKLFIYNPMYGVVKVYQDVLLFDRWPDYSALLYPGCLTVCLLILSFIIFRRASPELVDAL
jgi:lipopolysaccharide transport system permease protein